MGETFKKYRNYILGIFILIIGIWVYSAFFSKEPTPDIVAETDVGSTGEVGRDLLNLLLESNTIKLDGQLFSNEHFLRLMDFGKPIPPEAAGRNNPFAPVEGSVSKSQTAQPPVGNISTSKTTTPGR